MTLKNSYSGITMLMMLSFALFSCQKTTEKTPVIIEINDGWVFSRAGTDDWKPAEVPGTVHSDLMINGEIDDPYYRMNEDDVQWVEDEDWIYRTTFNVDGSLLSESEVLQLDFKGLDTYADVYLNDQKILEANNMFVGWEVNVKDYLKEGENELRIYFHSPVKMGMEKMEKIDYTLPAINEQAPEGERTSVFTRKAPFHYGWDWGPRLVTSGIWKPVILKSWSTGVIENVYVSTLEAGSDLANIEGYVNVNVKEAGDYRVFLNIDGLATSVDQSVSLDAGINKVPFEYELQEPELWWTNGLGEPYLYDFSFRFAKDDVLLDRHDMDFGVRTLDLIQTPDEVGYTFTFELNGEKVFMKGANIIPPETLTPSATDEDYDKLIQNAVSANMNMLRIWGGAIYGEDYLYELCDRNGILVWQDFMFSCALQPGDEEHMENIRREAEYNVKRLRNHPSLALWCGNNEIFHGWEEWGWSEMYDPELSEAVFDVYESIFHDLLAETVAELDPKSNYWPSSPMGFGGEKADRTSGDEHDWTVWFGQELFSNYGEDVPRFVSEYGLQSYPSMHTIRKFSEEQDWEWDSEVMRHRQRGEMPYISEGFDGNDMIRWYMEQYYNVPEDFENFVYVSQLLQAKAYKTAIEAHRRNMPICMGSLYWQLNDSWPTISWSTVDYYGHWKASHYAVRDANEAIILAPVIEGNELWVYGVSESLAPFEGVLSVQLMDFSGEIISTEEEEVMLPENASTLLFEKEIGDLTNGSDLKSLVAVVTLQADQQIVADNLMYFHRPKNLNLTEANVDVDAERTENGYTLTISTDNLAKNVFLDTPRGDGFFSDNFFDLLPGQTHVVHLRILEDIDPDEDISVLTLNDL